MKPHRRPGDREAVRHRAILPRFRDAGRGLFQAYREEPNLRFHVFAGSCVLVAGLAVGLLPWETAYLGATVAAVLLAEAFNTAIERTVDLASDGRRHPLAAQAKEVAAGAVLLTAAHAAFAAYLVFIASRGLWVTVDALLSMALTRPWLLALPLAAGWAGLALHSGGVPPERS